MVPELVIVLMTPELVLLARDYKIVLLEIMILFHMV
jgi:hypothetical protein